MRCHHLPRSRQGDKILRCVQAAGIGLLMVFAWLALGWGIPPVSADGPQDRLSATRRGPTMDQGSGDELVVGLAEVHDHERMAAVRERPSTGQDCITEWQRLSLPAIDQICCVSAGDAGPYFSAVDLTHYSPPPPRPTHKITPPVWTQYPDLLRDWPLAMRSYPSETITYLAEHEVHHGDRQSPFLALTFDCENETGATRSILETLRRDNVHATFFVTGRYAYMWPEVVRQIVEDGHELGNHSFFHPLFSSISPLTATMEITYTEAAIARAVGSEVRMRFFRFPYAGRDASTRLYVAALGYQSASWDLDTRGWEPGKTAEDVLAYMQRSAHGGGIVIMHCHAWNDATALPAILQAIRNKGLVPGTLSDVLNEADRTIPGYPCQ